MKELMAYIKQKIAVLDEAFQIEDDDFYQRDLNIRYRVLKDILDEAERLQNKGGEQ